MNSTNSILLDLHKKQKRIFCKLVSNRAEARTFGAFSVPPRILANKMAEKLILEIKEISFIGKYVFILNPDGPAWVENFNNIIICDNTGTRI